MEFEFFFLKKKEYFNCEGDIVNQAVNNKVYNAPKRNILEDK